jgi:hypothetical protein
MQLHLTDLDAANGKGRGGAGGPWLDGLDVLAIAVIWNIRSVFPAALEKQ